MESPIISLPTLPSLHFAVALSPAVLMGILILFFILYLIVSSVLFYHWTTYGMGSHGILVGEILFLLVSVLLFLVAFLSATYY